MSARRTLLHLAAKTTMLFAAIFVVTVLLVAMPGHHAPTTESLTLQGAAAPQLKPMPGMDMGEEKANEKAAVEDMTPGHNDAHRHHMYMTSMRTETPEDVQRANEVVTQLRAGIEKYKDYHAALDDGFKIFLPNIPQPEYHFTSYRNGFLESLTFDPARPTSLLYKKTATGYELVGAMYTMPKRATEDQLDARIPLSVAMWHLHTNLCLPPLGQLRSADWTKFGLKGSIITEDACSEAGGRFHPVIFGWMVHVYPYEQGPDNIFAMHHHMD
ncbi:MAG: hypothetical protein WA736_10720 [Candidatus Acidiferrum sp.]